MAEVTKENTDAGGIFDIEQNYLTLQDITDEHLPNLEMKLTVDSGDVVPALSALKEYKEESKALYEDESE